MPIYKIPTLNPIHPSTPHLKNETEQATNSYNKINPNIEGVLNEEIDKRENFDFNRNKFTIKNDLSTKYYDANNKNIRNNNDLKYNNSATFNNNNYNNNNTAILNNNKHNNNISATLNNNNYNNNKTATFNNNNHNNNNTATSNHHNNNNQHNNNSAPFNNNNHNNNNTATSNHHNNNNQHNNNSAPCNNNNFTNHHQYIQQKHDSLQPPHQTTSSNNFQSTNQLIQQNLQQQILKKQALQHHVTQLKPTPQTIFAQQQPQQNSLQHQHVKPQHFTQPQQKTPQPQQNTPQPQHQIVEQQTQQLSYPTLKKSHKNLNETIVQKEIRLQVERDDELKLLHQNFENNFHIPGSDFIHGTFPGDTSSCSGYYTLENSRLTSPEAPHRDGMDGKRRGEDDISKSRLYQKRATVTPYEDPAKLTEILPQDETVLEKEVRLSRQREGSLRKAHGYPLKLVSEKNKVQVSFLVPSKNPAHAMRGSVERGKKGEMNGNLDGVDGGEDGGNLMNNSQTFATNRLRMEILKERKRELELRKKMKNDGRREMNEKREADGKVNGSKETNQPQEYLPYKATSKQEHVNKNIKNNIHFNVSSRLLNSNGTSGHGGRWVDSVGEAEMGNLENKIEEEIEECQKREDELRQQRMQFSSSAIPTTKTLNKSQFGNSYRQNYF